jgi:hypothetical protein
VIRVASWSIAVLLATAPVFFAQSTPQLIPLQTTSGKGFTGAPYSGKQTTVNEKILTDGTRTTETFVQLLWRDAEGRTRTEHIQHTDAGAEYRSVIITDPVGGVYLKWTIGLESAKKVTHIWPVTTAQRVTASPPASQPRTKQGDAPRPGFQSETLPAQQINGVDAEGTRWSRTIHMDEESSHRVIEVTNENWVSPDLRIIVRHIHDDPRTGRDTTEVTDVVRGDPDPSLFQLPAGYQVVDHRQQNPQ